VTALFARGSPTAGSAERVLDRIAALDAPWARASVGTAVTAWAIREPEAALDWALGRATEVDPGLFTRIAVRTAQQDIDLAVGTIDRLPPAQRAEWLSGVAETLALRDPERAVELVGRYRGQAGHLPALAAVANQLVLSDPTRAAALLGDARALPAADAELAAVTVSVAWSWAGRDPRAAADWVAGLGELPGQPDAVSAIAQTWAQRDPDATRRWLGQLDSGAARDAGLESFLLARAQSGDFDAALLASFSSAQQAEDSAGHAIARIGRNDPDRARQLVNVHITDASVRARTLAEIGQPGAAGAGVSISNDGIRVR
jgi:hypothetical protein